MLLSLAVLTGARRGELCAMRWTDVEGDTIRIRRSLYRAGTDRGEKSTKGGRERWVVVAPAGRTLLEAWHGRCSEVAAAVDVRLVPDAFVVSPVPDGSRPVNPETFSSVVHKLCAELGMPHVHLHSLRHFAATEMLAAGIDPRNAAEILGHASPTLTLGLYGHATADRQRMAAEVLARTLEPPPRCRRITALADVTPSVTVPESFRPSGDLRVGRLAVELGRELRHVDVPATADLEAGQLPLAALAYDAKWAQAEQRCDLSGVASCGTTSERCG